MVFYYLCGKISFKYAGFLIIILYNLSRVESHFAKKVVNLKGALKTFFNKSHRINNQVKH